MRSTVHQRNCRVVPATAELRRIRPGGGRTWWARLGFARTNICSDYPPPEDRGFARGARLPVQNAVTITRPTHHVILPIRLPF